MRAAVAEAAALERLLSGSLWPGAVVVGLSETNAISERRFIASRSYVPLLDAQDPRPRYLDGDA